MDDEDQSLFNILQMGLRLNEVQQQDVFDLVRDSKATFGLGLMPIGDIKNHGIEINLTVDKPYPPALRKRAYPASPRNKVEIERHINKLTKYDVIRKLEENGDVEITSPSVVAWHHGKPRVCGDFRALNA